MEVGSSHDKAGTNSAHFGDDDLHDFPLRCVASGGGGTGGVSLELLDRLACDGRM